MPAFTLEGFESPEEVQARIGKAEEASFLPKGDINQMIYQTAARGAALQGGAVAGALGYEAPEVKKAKEIQEMMKDLDPTTSEGLYSGAKRLFEKGMVAEGSAAISKANEIRKIEAAEAPDPDKMARFKGRLTNDQYPEGEDVVAFSAANGDIYARVGGELVKNPKGLVERDVGKSEFDTGAGKKAVNTLEDIIISNETQLDSIGNLRDTFNERSLSFEGQFDAFALKNLEKAGKELTPEQAKFLGDHAVMMAEAKANLATYIKAQSGVAASEKERAFLKSVMPSDDDSKTTYSRKLERLEEYTKNNLSRSRWLLKNGLLKRGRTTRIEYESAVRKAPPLEAFDALRDFQEKLRAGKFKDPQKAKKTALSYFLKKKWDSKMITDVKVK